MEWSHTAFEGRTYKECCQCLPNHGKSFKKLGSGDVRGVVEMTCLPFEKITVIVEWQRGRREARVSDGRPAGGPLSGPGKEVVPAGCRSVQG